MESPIDHGLATWDALTERLDRFVEAWQNGGAPPNVLDFVPEGPVLVRRLTLVELLKVDLEFRWQTPALRQRLEDYGPAYAELGNSPEGLPADLVYEEYHVRKNQGEPVKVAEYLARFPALAEALGRLFDLAGKTSASTALAKQGRPGPLQAGTQLDDFDLLLKLGEGAFAHVFLARQRSMQRLVALKVSENRGSEPQTLAQLDHPHIVRVYDQRALPAEGMKLLYMQFVSGGTLQNVVANMRSLPPAARSGRALLRCIDGCVEAAGQTIPSESANRRRLAAAEWPETVCRLGAQLALALDYAHRRGVLHRDLKPANVLLAADGSPKLADFNVSYSASLTGATAAAYFGGSLAYMSPEQLEAANPAHSRAVEDLDGRSDLYSLGVVLWELLFGQRPFHDEPLEAGWSATLSAMARRRAQQLPDIPTSGAGPRFAALLECLRRCLQPDRDQRYASAGELARDLLLCLQPRARHILADSRRGWKGTLQSHPILAVVLATVLPNALAAWFNHNHNSSQALSDLGPAAVDAFRWAKYAINGSFFPLGGAIAMFAIAPVARVLWQRNRRHQPAATELQAARRRSLEIGQWAALAGVGLWSVAGFLYPIGITLAAGPVPLRTWLHFIFSHLVCGLIAAAFPYLMIAALSLRTFYPALLALGGEMDDERPLAQVAKRSSFYLFLAGAVPMLGVMMLILGQVAYQPSLVALCVAGAAGLAFAFYLHGLIQRDLAALLVVVRARDQVEALSDTVEVV